MNSDPPAPLPKPLADPYDFSIVLGGPLYQLLRRSHLAGDTLELLRRRVLTLSLFAWIPLLVLSLFEGRLWDGGVTVPFLRDIDVHVKFLVALPLLVVAELVVHQRIRPVIRQFIDRRLIPDAAVPKFEAALASAQRLRNSVLAEVLLLAFVFGVGVMIVWRTQTAVEAPGWYGTFAGDKWKPSVAGWWFGLVSLPLFQFILLRWYFRLFIWARLLWKVSRIDLQLVPTHPDRCGGLGFLGSVCFAFAPVMLAQGALLSGSIANQIFFAGAKLPEYKLEILAVVLALLVMVVGPLLVFIPVLARAKRHGLREYGNLAQGYVRDFDRKWLRGGAPEGETLLGSGDIQSLADLSNSFEVVRTMKIVPFGKESLIQLGVLALLPMLPLALTMVSFEDLLKKLLQAVF
jgi:hypothetical protein